MSHPDDAALAELAQGSLRGDSQQSVEAHVAQCATCRNLVAQLLKAFAPGSSEVQVERSGGPHKGLVVGRYVVLDALGAGALGEVFAAYDTTLERTVALKWLFPSVREHDRAVQRERLVHEARALAKVQHPNVVAVYDVEAQGTHDVLVMELVPQAQNLRSRLQPGTPWREVVTTFLDAAAGLAAAHAAGVVHRDFKPDNVLVDGQGRVRVADFGLARAAPADTVEVADLRRSTLTGTPAYLAPERWQGAAADEASDQFSFCASLYECLSGRLAFEERDPVKRLEAMKRGPAALSSVPAALEKAVRRGLSFQPAERFSSMAALADELSRATRAGQNRGAFVAFGALAVLALGSGALAWKQTRRCDHARDAVDAAWNAGRAEKVKASFIAAGHPASGVLAERVVTQLDRLAVQLGEARVTACESAAKGGESEALQVVRDGCLARRTDDLGALAGVFETADAKTVERSMAAVDQLPAAQACLEANPRAAVEPMPAGESLKPRIEAVRQQTSQVRALRLAGKTKDSAAQSEAAVTAARGIGWRPLLVEALVERSNTLERMMQLDDARAAATEAVQLGMAANDAVGVYDAAVGLVMIDGVDASRPQSAEAWVALARGAVESAGLQQTAEGMRVRNAEALTYLRAHRPAEAAKVFEQLVKQYESFGRQQTVGYARLLQNWSAALRESGQVEPALEVARRSLQMLESLQSPNHPDVATACNNIGSSLADLKRYDEAEPYFRRALHLRTTLYGADSPVLATTHYNLGELAYRRGDGATALTEYGASRALVEKGKGPDDDDAVDARASEALAMVLLGRHADALPVLEVSLVELQKRKMPAWNQAQVKLGLAQALHALGREPARVKALAGEVAALQGDEHAEQRAAASLILSAGPSGPESKDGFGRRQR